MTDPLGQSQVLPYLIGLSKTGYSFVILSFEKREKYIANKAKISEICTNNGIIWHPLMYTKRPPVLSTLWDIYRMKRRAYSLHKQYHFNHLHCRSHISSLAGDYLKRKSNIPFIFDMRGFYADERVDGKIWNIKNPIFKAIFQFFKKREKILLQNSVANISLTHAGKKIIHHWKGFENTPIDVIPCCADQKHFLRDNIDLKSKETWRIKLKMEESDFVISYLGSIGTWYMADEMFQFFNHLLKYKPQSKFLIITTEPQSLIDDYRIKHDIPQDKIIVQSAKRDEVPTLIDLSNISIFFIKPVFSKQASSPVKMGEILAMGIPIIANAGVGDVDSIIEETNCGILVEDFSSDAYNKAIEQIDSYVETDKSIFMKASQRYFSLEEGIESYRKIYDKIK